ncbi:uncharacterized protein LOC144169878 isoform X2 [Haemaphysalis longicornis]
MWPMVLDYTKDECQRMLRKLELEAYAAVVSAFRAQGELTKDKKKTLQELSNILCISLERHRAEIRRAVNDERLNTIAERIVGPNTSSDWAIEGRRLVPLMPRLVPQTAFSALANNIANNVAATAAAAQQQPPASKSNAASPTVHSAVAAVATAAAAVDREPLHATGNGPCLTAPSCSGLNGPMAMPPRTLQQGAMLVAPTGMTRTPVAAGCLASKLPGGVVVKTEPPSTEVPEKQMEEDSTLRKRKRSLSLDSLSSPPPAAAGCAAMSRVSPTVPATTSPPPAVAATAAAAGAAPAAPAPPPPLPPPPPSPRVTTNGPVVTKLVVPTSVPIATATGAPCVTTKVINLPVASASAPVRVSLASVQKTTVAACSQKVILVSTTTAAATTPSAVSSSLLQPPLAVPVVKTVAAPATIPIVHQGRAPTFIGPPGPSLAAAGHCSHSSPSPFGSSAAMTTVASMVTAPVPSVGVSVTSEPGVVRLRPRAVTVNPRLPLRIPTRGAPPRNAPPLAPLLPPPQHTCPLPSSASYGKATISVPKGAIMQYRQEGTVKIIAQGQLPLSSTKLVSKTGPGCAVPTASSSGSLSLGPRVSTVSITSNQPRVVNVITASSQPGGLVRTISRTVTPSVSSLSQRQSPTLGLRPMVGLHQGSKPNVIVVHKAQVWPQAQQAAGTSSSPSTSTIAHLTKSTESIAYLQRQDRPKVALGSPSTVTVVKTSLPHTQQCSSPLLRVSRDTAVRTLPPPATFMRKPLEPSLEASSTCSSNSGSSGGAGNSGAGSSSSTLLAEVMQAAGILQGQQEGGRGGGREGDGRGSQQPPTPPLLVVGEEAVPSAEVEVAVDTVPLDDNAVLLGDGHNLMGDNGGSSRETVVEEAPCLLQDQAIVCHQVEVAAQPGLQLEVVSTSPSPANAPEDGSSQLVSTAPNPANVSEDSSQPSQNGRLGAEEPASSKEEPGMPTLPKRTEPRSPTNEGSQPPPAPRSAPGKPASPDRKRPGLDGHRKDAPGNSNGVMAAEVAERLGLTVSGTIAIPASSASMTNETVSASTPANSSAIMTTQPARPASSQSPRRASHLSDSDLAVPGPSNVFPVASVWRHGAKAPHSSSSLPSRQQQLNGPQHASASSQPTPVVSVSATPSAFSGLPRESSGAVTMESVNENSNVDATEGASGGHPSAEPSASSNRVPSLSSAENSADNSVDNSIENLILRNRNRHSDDSSNDSSRESSSNEGNRANEEEEDSVGPTDVQDSISSSSSAAVLYLRNPEEEQSAIISSSSNDHGRRDAHKAKRVCDVSSSTSVSASPCLVVPTPSTAAIFGEHQLSAAASSTPSAPEQNSPDQTSEGTSSVGHFQLPSSFGEGSGGGGSSNVTSADLEISVVSSPTPDAQEVLANVCGEGSSSVVVGSEEQNNSAVESSEREEGPVEVSSAAITAQPGTSSQREEVTSAENGGSLSAANNEVTSAVSCPSFDDDDDDDDVDGNEAGHLVTALMMSSDEEVSTAEVVLVQSEDLAEITCSTVDATAAATASGSVFHLDMRPLSVSSTEESEYLGGSVEVDSHEVVPTVQAFSDVGTSSSCSIRGGAAGAAATAAAMGTGSPASDEASSDSHSGVESSRAVSASNSSRAEDQRLQNAASDQPTQSEAGDGLSVALAAEPTGSGNDAEEVYELLICDSEASEGITSVMVDSVSSTVFGAQRNAGPSPSNYHLLSLPSCSSSGPSTSSSSPVIDATPLTLAYHRTHDAAHLDTSSSSSSSSASSNSAQPIVADSSATLSLREDAATASNGAVPSCSSNGSRRSPVDNHDEAAESGSGSIGGGSLPDLATPGNVDEFEVCENGLASTSSSVGEVILVGAHACVAGTSSSEIVIFADGEVTADMTVSSENFNEDSSNNEDDVPSNSLGVSSSALRQRGPHHGLENGVQEGPASTSRFPANLEENSVASSAVADADVAVDSAVVVGMDPVERAVTSSAPLTSASLSQPSTSRGTGATRPQLLKRKRRVTALMDESLCASVHVSGWARVASGLLDRVCKFRGTNRSKGMLSPAHWFLEPVDPEDAPGYYDVIQQPMDFSTIRKKLEGGQYRELADFHEDMLLVQRNCQTYNPPEHEAWQDCEEVFAFYLHEYNRLVEKWQKSHLLSSPKRSKPS